MTACHHLRAPSLLMALALGSAGGIPGAAGQLPGTSPVQESPVPTAAVRVDGEILFRVRGVSALPPQERATLIARSIREATRDPLHPTRPILPPAKEKRPRRIGLTTAVPNTGVGYAARSP